ncbi:hypothetical protein PUN28_002230 [Cardiocondyla obscurior]|uniref:Uncharacterized protein n=1 Tax=Cardiocondyla obscurior TaxID=286306 RepID=A0AAW2GT66_9HYME
MLLLDYASYTYNKEKNTNKSDINKPSWFHFKLMDDLFGHKPWMIPVLTLDTSNVASTSYNSNSSSLSLRSPSPSLLADKPRKHRKTTEKPALERLMTLLQETKEERKKMHEEFINRQDRLLNILEKIANKM